MSHIDDKHDIQRSLLIPKEALVLIEHLRDRLVEAADCMEAGIESTHAAGLTTTDVERQIQDSRFFANEANNYLRALKVNE
jgi:hypothetical protein